MRQLWLPIPPRWQVVFTSSFVSSRLLISRLLLDIPYAPLGFITCWLHMLVANKNPVSRFPLFSFITASELFRITKTLALCVPWSLSFTSLLARCRSKSPPVCLAKLGSVLAEVGDAGDAFDELVYLRFIHTPKPSEEVQDLVSREDVHERVFLGAVSQPGLPLRPQRIYRHCVQRESIDRRGLMLANLFSFPLTRESACQCYIE